VPKEIRHVGMNPIGVASVVFCSGASASSVRASRFPTASSGHATATIAEHVCAQLARGALHGLDAIALTDHDGM
jgi:hypothetical protein